MALAYFCGLGFGCALPSTHLCSILPAWAHFTSAISRRRGGCPLPVLPQCPGQTYAAACQLLAACPSFSFMKALEGRDRMLSVLVTQPSPACLRASAQCLVNEQAVAEAAPSGCPQCQPAKNQGPRPTRGCGLSPAEGTSFHRAGSI